MVPSLNPFERNPDDTFIRHGLSVLKTLFKLPPVSFSRIFPVLRPIEITSGKPAMGVGCPGGPWRGDDRSPIINIASFQASGFQTRDSGADVFLYTRALLVEYLTPLKAFPRFPELRTEELILPRFRSRLALKGPRARAHINNYGTYNCTEDRG